MDLNEYQIKAQETALYPGIGSNPIYPTLGLAGEAGEVAEKVKKIIRDRGGIFDKESIEGLKQELGDVLWYVSQLGAELGLELEDIATSNLDKLSSRLSRGKLHGEGDRR